MVGDVTAATGLLVVDAVLRARALVVEDVLLLGAAPERDDRVMLEETTSYFRGMRRNDRHNISLCEISADTFWREAKMKFHVLGRT